MYFYFENFIFVGSFEILSHTFFLDRFGPLHFFYMKINQVPLKETPKIGHVQIESGLKTDVFL